MSIRSFGLYCGALFALLACTREEHEPAVGQPVTVAVAEQSVPLAFDASGPLEESPHGLAEQTADLIGEAASAAVGMTSETFRK